jgi:DNA gyrase subunit B
MTDADVDGSHIRTLLLTLFFRYFNPLVTNGNIYIAQPPLYQIKKGSSSKYAYTEEEKNKIIKELGGDVKEEETAEETEESREGTEEETKNKKSKKSADKDEEKKSKKLFIQRYKGLGEMNPEQLWETTMNPASRIVKQVTVEDAGKADIVFDMLMGDDVSKRKNFIQTHAKNVSNLDI